MASEVGFVDNTGSEGLAHWQMLLKIKTFAEANGWTTLRYLNPGDDASRRELILKGVGLSGTEEIFVGLRCYQSANADYYNMSVAGFIGYVDGNAFTDQPGYIESGIPAHNQRIDYWLAVNAQRIAFGLKVGTPVYTHGYCGKFYPYARPSQYPYPLAIGGMLNGTPGTRFSSSDPAMYMKGARPQFRMRFVDGSWRQPDTWPWCNGNLTGGSKLRDTAGVYPLLPVVVNGSAPNVYGELDGIFYISGFNNIVENTLAIGGKTYVVLQDLNRTGLADFYALEMD